MALVKYNQHSLQQYCSHVENTCMTASFHLREVVWAYKTSLLFHFHIREVVWAYETSLLLHFHLREVVWAIKLVYCSTFT
jgi:hypothetical protein